MYNSSSQQQHQRHAYHHRPCPPPPQGRTRPLPQQPANSHSSYDPTLTIEPEAPWLHHSYLFLGRLLWRATLNPVSYHLLYFIKNLFTISFKPSPIYQDHSIQIFRSELPYHAYQPRSMLFGQRTGMLHQALRSTDPPYHNLVLAAKLLEYAYYLQDPIPFMHSYCLCISTTYPLTTPLKILHHLKKQLPMLRQCLHCYPANTCQRPDPRPLAAYLRIYNPGTPH